MWRLERRCIFMSGFRCLPEIESVLFNCWERGFLSPWTLVPVGARCWIWEGFCRFCQITFSAAASVARLFMATPPTLSLEICVAWKPTLRDNDGSVSVIYVIQYFMLNLPTPAALSIQPIITSCMQKGFHAGYPKANSALLAMVLTNCDWALRLA